MPTDQSRCCSKRSRRAAIHHVQLDRSSLQSAPDSQNNEFDSCEEVLRIFVVPGGYAPEVFDLTEEALDQIALAINPDGERECALPVGLGWDVCPSIMLLDQDTDSVTIIALISQQGCAAAQSPARARLLPLCCRGTVLRSDAGGGAAFRIGECVDFTGESLTGTSHAAIVFSPLFPLAPCW